MYKNQIRDDNCAPAPHFIKQIAIQSVFSKSEENSECMLKSPGFCWKATPQSTTPPIISDTRMFERSVKNAAGSRNSLAGWVRLSNIVQYLIFVARLLLIFVLYTLMIFAARLQMIFDLSGVDHHKASEQPTQSNISLCPII